MSEQTPGPTPSALPRSTPSHAVGSSSEPTTKRGTQASAQENGPSPPIALVVPRPLAIEWISAAGVVLALISLALIRCDLTDTPYHLATARKAWSDLAWPTTNTFSYTHADYPLYQQYPIYQTILYGTWLTSGWSGLSLLHLAAWSGLFLLWLRWWGPWPWGVVLSFPLVVLVLGLRERMVLRPDLLTMLYFVLILLLIDRYRSGHSRSAWLLPVVLVCWVNSHQMFWIGLALQLAFLIHLGITRIVHRVSGLDWGDRDLPLWPIAAALLVSAAGCFLSPIGWRVLEVPAHTFGSLYFHRQNVDEFAPFYTSRQAVWLVLVSGAAALLGFAMRGRRQVPWEILVWLMGLAMVLGAIRGTAFFVAISLGVFARSLLILCQTTDTAWQPLISEPIRLVTRAASALLVLLLCGQIYWARWVDPSRILGGSQFGIGKTLGAWPDEAAQFLNDHLPPGRMMNLSWYSGNALIWEIGERSPVFVDPRFEAYPRSFLIDSLAAETEAATLDRLIDQYRPDWFVGELRVPGVRQQMARLHAEGEWDFVHIDPVLAILVRTDAEQADYLEDHRIDPSKIDPTSLLRDDPELLAQQQLRLASFLADLGQYPAARRWYRLACEARSHSNVAAGLAEIRQNYPELEATAARSEWMESSRDSQFAP